MFKENLCFNFSCFVGEGLSFSLNQTVTETEVRKNSREKKNLFFLLACKNQYLLLEPSVSMQQNIQDTITTIKLP